MGTELTKKLMCIVMRDGIEIWIEDEKIQKFKKVLMSAKESKFIELENEIINTADIAGVFSAQTMEELNYRKNGRWKCQHNYWHDKFEKCECNSAVPSYAKSWIKN